MNTLNKIKEFIENHGLECEWRGYKNESQDWERYTDALPQEAWIA